jgi:hypothetical protein
VVDYYSYGPAKEQRKAKKISILKVFQEVLHFNWVLAMMLTLMKKIERLKQKSPLLIKALTPEVTFLFRKV